jgi:nucleoside permease NupC
MTKKNRTEYILASLTLVIVGAFITAFFMLPNPVPAEATVPPVSIISETTTTYTEVIEDVSVGGEIGSEGAAPDSNW